MRSLIPKLPLVFDVPSDKVTAMTETNFNDLSSLSSYLPSRRSGRPRNLVEPGPTDKQIQQIIEIALRTPDHGKLAPWRVISIASNQRDRLAEDFKSAYSKENPNAGRSELEAMDNMAKEAPALLVVMFSPVESSKIPLWEQKLSCGAFCMNILHALHSKGFLGGWITGWPAYNDDVRDLFGIAPEKIAGFIFAGSSQTPLKERPRPDIDHILSDWDS
ncbi:MAG: nitroreductase [Parasphingorhabdus sp.]